MSTLAKWRSHKVVMAGKILALKGDGEGDTPTVVLVEGLYGPCEIKAADGLFARGVAKVGDYLVIYEPDGYQSWSPRDQFEAGYTRLEEAP